ncbi:MAG: DUF4145 domain-containing protein [Armatimonadetes bacterium]|nr:MAG: DUF4145 domain-containing protein [Armatimonadota bacterium]
MNVKIPYKAPEFQKTSFNCPFCNAFANQIWRNVNYSTSGGIKSLEETYICICTHCGRYSIWYEEIMIYPDFQGVEPPNDDLNEEIRADYVEASSILQKSPRGTGALLRLAIQKLCIQLGEKGQDLNTDIGNLVKNKNLPQRVQQSLDSLRVIGNEAVHPGTLDLKDDTETALSLFKLVNFIAEKMLTEPKEIEDIYNKIPESKKQQIKERDGK